jgi:hypothetical protein
MFAGCLQIMWAHLQLIRVEGIGYLQLIRAENSDVCRSYVLCLQAVTVNDPVAVLGNLLSYLNSRDNQSQSWAHAFRAHP